MKRRTPITQTHHHNVRRNHPAHRPIHRRQHSPPLRHGACRTRPGMYIGRLGDGNLPEDGIYVLLKEVVDNSIDEFKMNAGKRIEIDIDDNLRVGVRDYGRGIPQGKLVEAVSVLNTGGKYDSKAFKKSVELNGVGVKAVNALSAHFTVSSYRDGQVRTLQLSAVNSRATPHSRRPTRRAPTSSSSPTPRSSPATPSTTTSWRRCCATTPTSTPGSPSCTTVAALCRATVSPTSSPTP